MKEKQINQAKTEGNKADRRPYQKPQLTPLGDIRDVTMGGSPGFGDSGAGAPEKPF